MRKGYFFVKSSRRRAIFLITKCKGVKKENLHYTAYQHFRSKTIKPRITLYERVIINKEQRKNTAVFLVLIGINQIKQKYWLLCCLSPIVRVV
jgi:hypothetical protein